MPGGAFMKSNVDEVAPVHLPVQVIQFTAGKSHPGSAVVCTKFHFSSGEYHVR
jgi:hypothetical protein